MGLSDVLYAAYARRLTRELDSAAMPRHVGVMLDGNRRWARARGAGASEGHQAGADNIANLLSWCEEVGVEEIVTLLAARGPEVLAVADVADELRRDIVGDAVTFVRNRNINYTNVCIKLCRFCAFQRLPGQEGAYVMKPEEVAEKIRAQLDEPVTEVHMVAGIYPKLPYEYYLDILRAVKEVRPAIHIKAFTMIELMQIARRAKKPLAEVLPELVEAGLGSCPGGGGCTQWQRRPNVCVQWDSRSAAR